MALGRIWMEIDPAGLGELKEIQQPGHVTQHLFQMIQVNKNHTLA